ncbi:MAG: helix-turn-helix transcriptional regulator [Bacilli bacterium]|nr:helix-turn-helix transcriptional regulator [Bacilli bacterium]
MKDNLGSIIRKTRLEKNLTKDELANILDVSVSTITKWEKNISIPSFSNLVLITKELDLSFDKIILGHEINKKNKKQSEEELKKVLKENIRYKNIFNVFTGIFVCICLFFMAATLYKYKLLSLDANYIFLLVVFMVSFAAFTEILEKANLLEERNKYKKYFLLLAGAFILVIAGFLIVVVK